MKKFLALAMVLVLTLSLLLVSCNETVMDEDALEELEEINDKVREEIADIDGYKRPVNGDNNRPGNFDDYNDDYNGGSNNKGGIPELNGKTPQELYAQASNKINSLENLTLIADQDIIMEMEYQGETQTQTVKQSLVQKFDGNDFSLVTQNEMGTGEMNCQYVDGMVYNVQFTDGRRIKYEATWDQLYETLNMDPNESKVLTVPESWFKDVMFFEDKNSDLYYVEFLLDGDQYELLFDNLNAFDNVGINDISDVKYTVYFTENGDIDSMISTATMKMQTNGVDMNVKYVTTTTCTDIGSTVVEAPANPEFYTLVDISMVG